MIKPLNNSTEDKYSETNINIEKESFIHSIKDLDGLDIRNKIYNVAIVSIFSAAAVGTSVALLLIPNLETITLFIFLVAFVYGYRIGLGMMLTTTIVFEIFATATYGPATFLFPFKIISYSITVIIAGFLGKNVFKPIELNNNNKINISKTKSVLISLFFAFIGFILTLSYDIITLFAEYLIFQSYELILIRFIIGLPFFLVHEITNALMFMLIPILAVYMKQSDLYMFEE